MDSFYWDLNKEDLEKANNLNYDFDDPSSLDFETIHNIL